MELTADLLQYLTPEERETLELDMSAELAESDPVKWIEENFYLADLRRPITLADYQRRALTEALSRDASGNFKYSVIVWSDIKKSAKTSIAGAVALWRAHCLYYGQVLIVANDLKQAASRVGRTIQECLALNKELSANIDQLRGGLLFKLTNNTMIESIPVDPTGEAGGNADVTIYSELWGATSKAHKRMWTETTTPPNKYGRAFRWVETYAGFEGESTLLEQLYENVKPENKIAGMEDLPCYASGRTFVLWNETPRLSWQTPEYYAQEAAILTPSEFNRVHRNQWAKSAEQFVPVEWVDACRSDDIPELTKYTPVVIALDAGTSSDNFGIVGVSVETKTVNAGGQALTLRYCSVRFVYLWQPEQGRPIEYSDPVNSVTHAPEPKDPARPAPETVMRELAKNYHIVEWVYDPYQLLNLCTRLGNDGLGYFVQMSQHSGGQRAKADKNLFDMLRDKTFRYSSAPDLAQHIKNANAKREGEGLRLVKRNNSAKIDLAVCASMACYEALSLNI